MTELYKFCLLKEETIVLLLLEVPLWGKTPDCYTIIRNSFLDNKTLCFWALVEMNSISFAAAKQL